MVARFIKGIKKGDPKRGYFKLFVGGFGDGGF